MRSRPSSGRIWIRWRRAGVSGQRPAILSLFVEDIDRAEWRGLRESLELEGGGAALHDLRRRRRRRRRDLL